VTTWLPLVPLWPLVGFLALFLSQGRLPKAAVRLIGAGSVGLSAACALAAGADFLRAGGGAARVPLWTLLEVGGLDVRVALHLDGLSLVMLGVVTGVGFLIHLYSTGYMADEPDASRFFACMNLFMFSMLMLVLGDDLLILYLGWEGVGLCSYLLIGFSYQRIANVKAARKAFVVTRIGDVALALGMCLLFHELGTLEIQRILATAPAVLADRPELCTVIALLLLGGAAGKSAQIPLQTWLPDAMAGPTPVSALIHAATMVTAGVYLIARMHGLYLLSPDAQQVVAIVGLATLLVAAFAALAQRDLKRVLAYSTISQIGYMFLALGVGAWSAAIFHLMTHAFFKALLFLAAGSVIAALHHEQDVFRMGGLWRKLPIPFATMLVGSAALAALPFTSGYFSKDAILLAAHAHGASGPLFWAGASLGAFVTAVYCTRMIAIVFFGETRTQPHDRSTPAMNLVLLILAALALGGGGFGLSAVADVLPDHALAGHAGGPAWVAWVTTAIPLLGVGAGALVYRSESARAREILPPALVRLWGSGFGFDAVYEGCIVNPFRSAARLVRRDWLDGPFIALASTVRALGAAASGTQTGAMRWYALNMAAGLVLALFLVWTLA